MKVNMWPPLLDDKTIEEDLELLSTPGLHNHQLMLRNATKTTIDMIICYAEMAASIDSQFQRIIALENYFTRLWDKLSNTIVILGGYAVLLEGQKGEMKKSYNDVLSKEIALLESVRSGRNITAEWLAQRDQVVAQARNLMDVE